MKLKLLYTIDCVDADITGSLKEDDRQLVLDCQPFSTGMQDDWMFDGNQSLSTS